MSQGKKLSRRAMLRIGTGAGIAFTVLGVAACQQPTPTPTAAPAKPTEAPKASGAAPTAAPAAAKPAAQATAAPAAKPAASTGTVTISFSSQGNPRELEMFERILKGFEDKNPNIKVERKFDPSLTWEKIHTMLGAGTAASVQRANDDDIFMLRGLRVINGLDDYVKQDMKREDYYKSTWESRVGAGAEVAAFTNGSSPMVIWYNVDHFKEAGLTAPKKWADAWTLDQFNDALKKLTKKDGSGKVTRYAFSEESWSIQQYFDNWGAQRYNENETECTLLKTPAALEALTWWQDIYMKDKYAYWPAPGESAAQSFNSGLVSMTARQTSFAASIKKDMNYDIMPMFKGKAGKNLTENSERCFVMPTGEKNPDQAWKLGLYFWQEPGQKEYAAMDYAVPVLIKVAESAEFTDPKRAPANRAIYGEGVAADVLTHNNPMGDDFQKWFSRTVNELTSGQKDPKLFLEERVQRLNDLIKQQNWDRSKDWNKNWTTNLKFKGM